MSGQEGKGNAKLPRTGSRFLSRLKNNLHLGSKDDRISSSTTQIPSKPLTTTRTDKDETPSHCESLNSAIAQGTIGITDSGKPQAGSESQGVNSAVISSSPLPNTSLGRLSGTDPINETMGPSSKLPSQVAPVRPIRELWDQAFDDLRAKEENLVKDYEATLSGNLKTIVESTTAISGFRIRREDQMKMVLKEKIEEVKKNTWKLKFSGKEVPAKDLIEPVVGIIDWTNDYIGNAVSANPYASIAWAGVSLILPVSLVQTPFIC
jgi:hypothetical protein